MNKLEEEIILVGQTLDRLSPKIDKYFHRLCGRHGATVAISVASNIATSLMAYALTVVDRRGGDSDEMWRLLRAEVLNKAAKVQIEHEQSHTLQ